MGDEFESPLEVLSRAASMVAKNSLDSKDSRGNMAPELPSRTKKGQRSIDRGNLYKRPNSNSGGEPEETPLDMSTKRDCPPPQYQRPSVITCASALRAGASHCSNTNNCKKDDEEEDKVVRKRRVEVPGICDPVIDEHFRRSLGKDYQQVFETKHSLSSTGMSVDDHFAKALGETWYRLQAQSKKAESNKTSNGNTSSNGKSTSNGNSPILTTSRGNLVST